MALRFELAMFWPRVGPQALINTGLCLTGLEGEGISGGFGRNIPMFRVSSLRTVNRRADQEIRQRKLQAGWGWNVLSHSPRKALTIDLLLSFHQLSISMLAHIYNLSKY